jgi:hypothetical protein
MNDIDVYMSYRCNNTPPSKIVLDMHEISVHYVKKHYNNCNLITDSNTKKYLKNLPFTAISTELDEIKDIKSKNWAIGKLFAYRNISKKRKPFLHLDYDVFLKNKISENFLCLPVFTQNEEHSVWENSTENSLGFGYNTKDMLEYDYSSHNLFTPSTEDRAYNLGIFGGTDYEFIEEYATKAINFTLDENNKKMFEKLDKTYHSRVSIICEQYLLWNISKKENKTINTYLSGETWPEVILNGQNVGYFHLHGTNKQHKHITSHISNVVRSMKMNPNYEPEI